MKKTLLLIITLLATTLSLNAQKIPVTYNNIPLKVEVNGITSSQLTPVNVLFDMDTYKIDFTLPNFKLADPDDPEASLPIGNIAVPNLQLMPYDLEKGIYAFTFEGDINIPAGDEEGIDEDDWMGPMISPIPSIINGRITLTDLYVSIDINMMETLGQIIKVEAGDNTLPIKKVTAQKETSKQGTYRIDGTPSTTANTRPGILITQGRKVMK